MTEINKIAYQGESITVHAVRDAIEWLMKSHMLGCVSEEIAHEEYITDNERYYFGDMGIAYYFLCRTGAPFNTIREVLNDNFEYLTLRRGLE